MTKPEAPAPTEEALSLTVNGKLALANWQKYNGDKADEVVYQAEKLATALTEAIANISLLSTEKEAMREALAFIADTPDPGEEKERSATHYRVHAAMLKQVAAKAIGRETVSQEAFDMVEEWMNSEEGRTTLAKLTGEGDRT